MPGSTKAAVRKGYIDGRFGQIHYRFLRNQDKLTPLLLLHASPLSSLVFENLILELGNDRFVIAPDTPGFGESSPPDTPPEIEDYAGAVADTLDALKLKKVDIVGYHTGSLTAGEFALREPERVGKIVMISSIPFTSDELARFKYEYSVKPLSEMIAAIPERWAWSTDFWSDQPNDIRRFEYFLESMRHPEISSWGHRAAFNYDCIGALKKILHPILVLNPQDDLWEYTPRTAALMKNGRVLDLPNWNHGFLDTRTKDVARILREFLDTTG